MNDKQIIKKENTPDGALEHSKKNNRTQIRNFRNFGITFAVSFVILGIVAIFASRFVANTVCDVFTGSGAKNLDNLLNAETTAPSDQEQDERFTRALNGKSFTWLMVVTDERPSIFDNYYPDADDIKNLKEEDTFGILGKDYRFVGTAGIALVHANVEKREYTIMAIPPITRVETGTGDFNLSEIYSYYGIEFLKAKVEGLTGMIIDYYTVLNCTDLASLANVIGGVDCKIPVDIYANGSLYVSKPPETSAEDGEGASEDASQFELELEKSDLAKLSAKLEAALLYSDLSDGVADEMTIFQSFAQGVLKNLSKASQSGLITYYEGLKNKFRETNLDQTVVKDAAEVIQAYSWLEVQTLVYPGRFVPAKGSQGAYYNPDLEEAVQYFYKYR